MSPHEADQRQAAETSRALREVLPRATDRNVLLKLATCAVLGRSVTDTTPLTEDERSLLRLELAMRGQS